MTTTPDRTAGPRAARAKDSVDKRRRALAAITALEAAGTPITAAAVARTAGVHGVPPTFRTAEPIGSVPERSG